MRTLLVRLGLVVLVAGSAVASAQARGFGGFRAGGFSAGGYRAGGYSFDRSGGYGGRDFSYSGSRSASASVSAFGGAGARGSYDRSLSGPGGGSLSVSGTRGAAVGPYGGVAAGGTRTVSGTTPGGRSFDTTSSRGGVMGPGGNYVGGASRYGVASGPGGTIAGGARWGAAGGVRLPTDVGLGHYSTVGGFGVVGNRTTFWSNNYLANRAVGIRGGFLWYHSFNPVWYTAHPGAWLAAGWAANAAWNVATWPSLATFVDISAPPVYLDYGNTIVYQNNNVYVNGTEEGPAEQYNQQAINLASAGQEAKAPKTDKWQSLGVFSLVQGEEKTSNTMFQLAVDRKGIIRGTYYDALMDTSTEVYGPWTRSRSEPLGPSARIKTPVFETGIYNLTKEETPVLVHFGKTKAQQWLLVRVEKPKPQDE